MPEEVAAFEEGPTFTEEGQFCDPEFVVYEENTQVDVTERQDLDQLMVNPEMFPLTADSFSVKPVDIDETMQELRLVDYDVDYDAVIRA